MANTLTLTDAPAILTPKGREFKDMPVELFRAIDQCDQTLRRYGMQMQIYCEQCHVQGHPEMGLVRPGDEHGDENNRNGTSFRMTCRHATWRLDFVKT